MLFSSPNFLPPEAAQSFGPPALLIAGIVVILVGTALHVFTKHLAFVIIGLYVFLALCVSGVIWGAQEHKAAVSAAAQTHNESISDWLDDVYGIDANASDVGRLLHGNGLMVQYQGDDVLIELKAAEQGKIAVYAVDNRTMLAPVN